MLGLWYQWLYNLNNKLVHTGEAAINSHYLRDHHHNSTDWDLRAWWQVCRYYLYTQDNYGIGNHCILLCKNREDNDTLGAKGYWYWVILHLQCIEASGSRYMVRMNGYIISHINSSPPGQNGRYFADGIFRCVFVNEKFCILISISLKFLPKGPIDNIPALV